MRTSRTLVNLFAVAIATAALLVYATTKLLTAAVFDPTYPLYAELPRTGGLVADKQVTYNGRGIGRVTDLALEGDRVRVEMAIDDHRRVPRDVDVVVQRASAIGEQVLDIRPTRPMTGGTRFYEPGETLAIDELTLPPRIDRLVTLAHDVFEPVDEDDVGVVLAELADAVRGRQDEVRDLLADSAVLSENLADSGEDLDRFFAASRRLNRALAANRGKLAGIFADVADATTILTDMRDEFEAVLVEAPPTLALVGDLVERSQPNLSCVIRDLANATEFTAQPAQLTDAAEALRLNRQFFDGFHGITNFDPFGGAWQRVLLETGDEGQRYPTKRPVPAVLPGGACASPFGPGAPAASQDGFDPVTTETRVVPPEDAAADAAATEPGRAQAASGEPVQRGAEGAHRGIALVMGAGLLGAVARRLPRPPPSRRRSTNESRG